MKIRKNSNTIEGLGVNRKRRIIRRVHCVRRGVYRNDVVCGRVSRCGCVAHRIGGLSYYQVIKDSMVDQRYCIALQIY